MEQKRSYIAIDLKSFYASVECVERGLDPLSTNLVIADEARTEKTICLAVSPSLRKYGIAGRARLFEVIQKCREHRIRTGEEIEYMIAPPRMQLYLDYSSRIYQVYLKYISPEDIHVYSIDEVFMDVTNYLQMYGPGRNEPATARQLAMRMMKDVLRTTGITATAGIGSNLYLAKVAMDIEAKHAEADAEGVRIAELDEISYRKKLWEHQPLTDFWRIGRGISGKLEANGMLTMGDVARMSMSQYGDMSGEDFLFKLFGVDAELLIDHSWGVEPCTMADIKKYKPESNSMSSGQVLSFGYEYYKARIVIREMAELLVLELVAKRLVTNLVIVDVGYDREQKGSIYQGEMSLDPYGRTVPKPAHGSCRLKEHTSSTELIVKAAIDIFEKVVNRGLLVRRINIGFGNVEKEEQAAKEKYEQLELFTDYEKVEEERIKERKLQEAVLEIQAKYGKNAILKGTNLEEGATTIKRNRQIGGHKA